MDYGLFNTIKIDRCQNEGVMPKSLIGRAEVQQDVEAQVNIIRNEETPHRGANPFHLIFSFLKGTQSKEL